MLSQSVIRPSNAPIFRALVIAFCADTKLLIFRPAPDVNLPSDVSTPGNVECHINGRILPFGRTPSGMIVYPSAGLLRHDLYQYPSASHILRYSAQEIVTTGAISPVRSNPSSPSIASTSRPPSSRCRPLARMYHVMRCSTDQSLSGASVLVATGAGPSAARSSSAVPDGSPDTASSKNLTVKVASQRMIRSNQRQSRSYFVPSPSVAAHQRLNSAVVLVSSISAAYWPSRCSATLSAAAFAASAAALAAPAAFVAFAAASSAAPFAASAAAVAVSAFAAAVFALSVAASAAIFVSAHARARASSASARAASATFLASSAACLWASASARPASALILRCSDSARSASVSNRAASASTRAVSACFRAVSASARAVSA